MPYGFSQQYFIYILGILVVLFAQNKLSRTYQKYRSVQNSKHLNGMEVAQKILSQNGVYDVRVEMSKGGMLSDHYDPTQKVVRLSSDIYNGTSIASIAVAAHECGHVLQHANGYKLLAIRAKMIPIVNLATKLGWISLFLGLFLFSQSTTLLKIGIIMLSCMLVFQLLTLPIEFDASSRAIQVLKGNGMIESREEGMARSMLNAAAFTYVASLISTLMQVLRIILIARSRDNRR